MKKFLFNSIIRKQQPKGVFIKAIWKSWHRYLSISITIEYGVAKKIFLPWEFSLLKKLEYLCSFLCLVMVSVPLCYKYLFLHDLLFMKSKAFIGVLEKRYLNIRKHPSWCFKKTTAPKISAYFPYFPAKHPVESSF